MPAGDLRIGLDGEFHYGDSGSTATNEHQNIHDVNFAATARTAEALRRKKKFVTTKPTYLEASLTFKLHDEEGDALIPLLRAAWANRTRIALYPTDAAGGDGLDADYYILKCARNESNPDFIVYDVEAKPTDEERDPVWQ